jgi:hypothetical protein
MTSFRELYKITLFALNTRAVTMNIYPSRLGARPNIFARKRSGTANTRTHQA